MSERSTDTNGESDSASPAVELSVHIEASPDTVWGILSTAERFSTWMGGQVAFETRAGSPYRAVFAQFHMVLAGEVLEFDDLQRRFVLSWGIESGPQAETMPAGSSRVEFRVADGQGGAHVDVRHSGFLSARTAREHEDGWRFHLGRLALFANKADLAAGLARALPAWWAAWNEPDKAARLKSLRSCLRPRCRIPRRLGGGARPRPPQPAHRQLPSLHARLADRAHGRCARLSWRGAGGVAFQWPWRGHPGGVQPCARRLRWHPSAGRGIPGRALIANSRTPTADRRLATRSPCAHPLRAP